MIEMQISEMGTNRQELEIDVYKFFTGTGFIEICYYSSDVALVREYFP